MKTLRLSVTMHFRVDARLDAYFFDSDGRTHHVQRSVLNTAGYDNWYNDRKEFNQTTTEYVFRIDDIPDDWELSLLASTIGYGFLNARNKCSWNSGSPIRTDTLATLKVANAPEN